MKKTNYPTDRERKIKNEKKIIVYTVVYLKNIYSAAAVRSDMLKESVSKSSDHRPRSTRCKLSLLRSRLALAGKKGLHLRTCILGGLSGGEKLPRYFVRVGSIYLV